MVVAKISRPMARLIAMGLWFMLAAADGSKVLASYAYAEIIETNVFNQTSATTVVSANQSNFIAQVAFNTPFSYTSGTLSTPGPVGTVNLLGSTSYIGYNSANYSNPAALNTAFPSGTYTFNISGPSGSASIPLALSVSDEPDIPALSASTYSALASMNTQQPFAFQWNAINSGSNSYVDGVGLYVTTLNNGMSQTVFSYNGTNQTSTTATAGTFIPGHTYYYTLAFTQTIVLSSTTQIEFNDQTDGSFTISGAVVPEPSSLLLLATGGLASVGWASARGRCRRTED
jgi:hypothetical protein